MSKSATRKASSGVLEDGVGRSYGSPPQLLAQIPGSLYTSPGFILGIVAVEIVYGLFLFVVMSGRGKDRAQAPELYAATPRVEPPSLPPIEPAAPTPSVPPKDDTVPKAEPPPAPKDIAPAPTPKESPQPAPEVKKKAAKKKRKKDSGESPKAVALAPSPKPEDLAPKVKATIPPLGPLIDPLGDCGVKSDGDVLTITVPPGLHIFAAQSDIANAPRALADVSGDFLAQVKVAGDIRAGLNPVKGLNFTFQGAGLLLWQDKGNYVRLERTSSYTGERFHRVFLESSKDGKPGKSISRNVSDGPVELRLERRGRDLIYSYSTDGKTWLKLDQSSVSYAPNLSIGVSASNASTRKLDAKFADFVLRPSP